MHKKDEINQTKIKGGCQSGRKVVTYDSKSDLPLKHDKSADGEQVPNANCIAVRMTHSNHKGPIVLNTWVCEKCININNVNA